MADANMAGYTYSYQWIRVSGDSETVISGETSNTYEVLDSDVGKKLKVRVVFKDDAGAEETRTTTTKTVKVPSDDASLRSIYVRGGGLLPVPPINEEDTETELRYRMPNDAPTPTTPMYFTTRDNGKVYSISGEVVGTEAVTQLDVGVDQGTVVDISVQVTAEDGETSHRYNIKLYAQAATPTAVEGALATAAFTINEWGYMTGQTTGMKGVYEQTGIGAFASAPNGSEGSFRQRSR